MRQVFFSAVCTVILILSFFTNWYGPLSISLLLLLIGAMLYKIGKGIVLLEMTALLYVFTCLVMPVVGYAFYSADNPLSRLWVRYMLVDEDTYFQYALPAVASFCIALTLPSFREKPPDTGSAIEQKIVAIRQKLKTDYKQGLQIIILGIIISVITQYLPASLNYFATLFFFGSFAGLLYVYFSPAFPYKKIAMLLFVLFILANALQSGMFTIVAYMSITIFSFFQLGKRSTMIKKVIFMVVAIAFFLVLQNVKTIYRKSTWKDTYEGNKVELFSNLFADNVLKGNALLSVNALFPIYSRTNQGFNITLVMRRIPANKPYDQGSRLFTVFASAFVPRFFWTDKPEAGGKFNMQYYAGWSIAGWSTNVGPLGEAYGSFGPTGGIVYMFLLGLFLRWVYLRIFKLSAKIPLIICWLPVMFYQVISSAETDSLQIMNSVIKAAFFIWLLTKFLPGWFGIVRRQVVKRRAVKNSLA